MGFLRALTITSFHVFMILSINHRFSGIWFSVKIFKSNGVMLESFIDIPGNIRLKLNLILA